MGQTTCVRRDGHPVLLSIATTTLLIFVDQVEASNSEARSAPFAAVSAAIASAKGGDTVIVLKETATWTTPLHITDNITCEALARNRR
jgi:hypothetical protein